MGRCSDQLTAARGDRYQGQRSCGQGLETPVPLSIPPSVASDDARLAAMLAIVLAQ